MLRTIKRVCFVLVLFGTNISNSMDRPATYSVIRQVNKVPFNWDKPLNAAIGGNQSKDIWMIPLINTYVEKDAAITASVLTGLTANLASYFIVYALHG